MFSREKDGSGSGNDSKYWKARKSPSLQLPLYYKDKPTHTPSVGGTIGYKFRHLLRSNSKMAIFLKAFFGSLSVYFFYIYLISSGHEFSLPKSSSKVDWKIAQQEVKDVFLESWHTYEKYGWGYDIYHPIKQQGENMGPKPLGWMIVDSIDTLMIMDAKDEVSRATKWIKDDLDYKFNYNVNVFETTIRMVGGLLSAFHLSKDDMFLDKAADLANAIEGAFKTRTGIPLSSVNLESGEGVKNHVDAGASSTAEVATLQLEFKYLAHLTGEQLYWQRAEKVMEVLESNKPVDGLVPIYVNPDTGKYQGRLIRLGSRGDSYYEYLLKQYLQTNQQEPIYWDLYHESVLGVKKHLIRQSKPNGLYFIGELEQGIGGQFSSKMDHLVCFYGGLLALGATNGLTLAEARLEPNWNDELEEDFKLGAEITKTCYHMYSNIKTGLSPEIVVFNEDENKDYDFSIRAADRHNLQRPETVESLFILYRLTGDEKYRIWGYDILQSFKKYSKVKNSKGEVSYTSLDDVTIIPPRAKDNVESFWWAETLKYLYLLFDDTNKIPLDKYVFNTEAHPFPKFDLTDHLKTGWIRKISGDKEPEFQPPVQGKQPVPGRAKEAPAANAKAAIPVSEQQKAGVPVGKVGGQVPVIDKKNPPQAQPVDKSVEKEVEEQIKKNPKLAKEENKEDTKAKLNKIIQDIQE
ncbi:mannosyl oligosaccharide 1,2-alpha-mannosidase [Scheffersomyces amazonensis]|uniref:mannosyl oligosaccharide 1,2-alpha-mannosidase n=1 Tax=Scheffersomyces amazonensis TaxID=1078765 RepID=UPI00315D1222